jgi:hypothetical protein
VGAVRVPAGESIVSIPELLRQATTDAFAFFLPFPCNKEQQTAANEGTKRRLKIAKFYE